MLPSANTANRARGVPPAAVRYVMLFGLVLASFVQAQTNDGPRPVPLNAYPGDHVFVPLIGGGYCSNARLDPARPPQIRQISHFVSPQGVEFDNYVYEINYQLLEPTSPLCGLAPPPPTFYADVGELPLGVHLFDVVGTLEDAPLHRYRSSLSWVRRHPGLPNEISGLWYDPAQGGRGLSVMKSGVGIVLIWYTHDQLGEPLWLVMITNGGFPINGFQGGVARGTALRTHGPPLGSGPSDAAQEPWGEIAFSYSGCGRATFAWTPLDPAIDPGSQTLVKLAQDVTAPVCAPRADARAVWVDAR